jgi:FkbM family methyltransferase
MNVSFKGHPFRILEGTTHPAYSLECFTADEAPFRDAHWDIQPGDVVVDAGASYGAYTLTALAAGAADVWAFEPEPTVFKDLCRNLDANGYARGEKAFAAEIALWDKAEVIDMRDYASHWPEQTITGKYNGMPLDDMTGSMTRWDWFKVDVEGCEERVIKGAMRTIQKFRPKLIIEAHTFIDQDIPKRIKEFLPRYRWKEVPRDPCVMMIGEAR